MKFLPFIAAGMVPLFTAPIVAGQSEEMAEENVIPKAYSIERYAPLLKRPLFGKKKPPPAEQKASEPKVSFARDLVLRGLIRRGDSLTAVLFNQATQQWQDVTTEAGPNQIRLISAEENPNPELVKVKIAKGDQEATVVYSKATLAAAPSNPGASSLQQPQRPPQNPPAQLPPGMGDPSDLGPPPDFTPPSLPPGLTPPQLPQNLLPPTTQPPASAFEEAPITQPRTLRPSSNSRRLKGLPRPQPSN